MNYAAGFIVFSKPNCPYCDQAKALLKSKDLAFTEVMLDVGQPKEYGNYVTREFLFDQFPDLRTMPLILKDGVRVGGFTELKKLLSEAL
jgi:glutaredoxin